MPNFRFRVDVTDLDRDLTQRLRRWERLASQALFATAEEALVAARRTTLFRDVTGKLRSSMLSVPKNFFLVQLQANTKYASCVHDGTEPHTISAKGGGFLRFQVGGRWASVRSVQHPGTTARPFLFESAQNAMADLAHRIEDVTERAFNE